MYIKMLGEAHRINDLKTGTARIAEVGEIVDIPSGHARALIRFGEAEESSEAAWKKSNVPKAEKKEAPKAEEKPKKPAKEKKPTEKKGK